MISHGEVPAHFAARLGLERWALKHGSEVVTWAELDWRSTRRAWALKGEGVGQDDLVTLSLPNGAAFFEFTFALWKLGATPHVVSWRAPRAELAAILETARPRLVVTADPALRSAFSAKGPEFGLAEGREAVLPRKIASHWKAMSSGGSTGRAKIIVDHAPSLVDPGKSGLGLTAGEVALNPGPTYHNAPFMVTRLALFGGASVVGMERFDAETTLRLIEEDRVAYVCLVPTMMHRIWRLREATRAACDLSSLREVWHMAAPMPPWLKEAWIEWLGPERIFELYGGTEGQGHTTISGGEWLRHRGSVGKPAPGQVRILDEDGKALAAGEVGEIYFSPAKQSGYHYLGAEPRRTADGWESLGDFGWLDADGYLYIADRRTDMILSGGANIYPAEVESALMEHPEVAEAVVIGLPDEDLGASIHAVIRLASGGGVGEAALAAFLAERLARNKIPRYFEFTQELLRDDAGKVRRSRLREERMARGA